MVSDKILVYIISSAKIVNKTGFTLKILFDKFSNYCFVKKSNTAIFAIYKNNVNYVICWQENRVIEIPL